MHNVTRIIGCSLVLIMGLAATPCTAQTSAAPSRPSGPRVRSEPFTYARLGYGAIAGDQLYGGPGVGFGVRAELDSMGIDVSFLNFQVNNSSNYSSGASAGSLVKLEVLHFRNPAADRAGYYGGGLGWGWTSFSSSGLTGAYTSGSGLEGELTAGYELGRTTNVRFFAQTDAAFPLYTASWYRYPERGSVITATHRYAPSLVFSLGLGWQHGRH